ncbi:MAG: sugar transporter, ATP-binding component [Subtercola sp.]|nr:sugar transporter, ATP-binding component [Subtercola sp.]
MSDEAIKPELLLGDPDATPHGIKTIALDIRGLSKAYGGNQALRGVDLTVRSGEVHALLGQNGCGKSTLVKCLTGVERADEGEVTLYGQKLEMPVGDPHSVGIAVIHQDIGLVDSMTVLENLGVAARYGTRELFPVNNGRERSIYRDLMQKLDLNFTLDALVSTLSPAERALLGVLRAFRLMDGTSENQLFILDEPTAALSGPEAIRILSLMRRVADLGFGVIFISHRLQEVMDICDRATVMRAGAVVADVKISETTRGELVSSMLGRRIDEFFPSPPPAVASDESARLIVNAVTGRRISDLSFSVRSGEVVGVTGLAGMGQEELPYLISGAERLVSGSVVINGEQKVLASPQAGIRAGISLVPGNRLRDGIWSAGTAEENVTMPVLGSVTSRFGLNARRLRQRAVELMRSVSVHPDDPTLPMAAFSGGNQQKVVFAKWMQLSPSILLLDEPTQGVDPGSAKELLTDAMNLAADGTAVVVFSGDHEQLAAICHRVIVLQHGRMTAVLSGDNLTEENLLHACEQSPVY